MEADGTELISYFVALPVAHEKHLRNIRQWEHLLVAKVVSTIWIKNFTNEEINSSQIKMLPNCECYYAKDGFLYQLGKLLPSLAIPSLDWMGIQQAYPLQIDKYNHNLFGINHSQNIELIKAEKEQEPVAILCSHHALLNYVNQAALIRLKVLKYVLINQNAFVFGVPILPIEAQDFWLYKQLLIPVGYQLNHPFLYEAFIQKAGLSSTTYAILNLQNQLIPFEEKYLKTLSKASLINSIKSI